MVKVPLYARHGIPEVWIVDLDSRAVEIHLGPSDGAYTQTRIASVGDRVAVRALPGASIAVADIIG